MERRLLEERPAPSIQPGHLIEQDDAGWKHHGPENRRPEGTSTAAYATEWHKCIVECIGVPRIGRRVLAVRGGRCHSYWPRSGPCDVSRNPAWAAEYNSWYSESVDLGRSIEFAERKRDGEEFVRASWWRSARLGATWRSRRSEEAELRSPSSIPISSS